MSRFAALVIVGFFLVGQVSAEPPGAEQMKEFAEATMGDWIRESVIDFDLPDVCSKGDKLITHSSKEWVLDGTVLITKLKYEINGKVIAETVALAGWDPAAKGIRSNGFGSLGGATQGVWKKQRGKWVHRIRGILPDGRKHSSVATMTVVDANTRVHKITQRRLGDEKLEDLQTTTTRVK